MNFEDCLRVLALKKKKKEPLLTTTILHLVPLKANEPMFIAGFFFFFWQGITLSG